MASRWEMCAIEHPDLAFSDSSKYRMLTLDGLSQLEFQGKSLPTHVHREFEAYLKCGRLEHGFLRVRFPFGTCSLLTRRQWVKC